MTLESHTHTPAPRLDPGDHAPAPRDPPNAVGRGGSGRDRLIAAVFVLTALGLLTAAGTRPVEAGLFVPIIAASVALLYGIGAVGVWFRLRWAWGLAIFLILLGILVSLAALAGLLVQINDARAAAVALNWPVIATRVGLMAAAVAAQALILRHLSGWEVAPASLALPYVAPALAAVGVFSLYPIAYNVGLSVTNRNLFRFEACPEGLLGFETCPSQGFVFAGLANYAQLLGNLQSDFVVVMTRSVVFTAICVVLFFVIGLMLALLIDSPLVRGRVWQRVALIVPWAVPFYISALVWRFFFNGEFGTINNLLRVMGWTDPPAWLSQPTTAFGAVVLINVWMTYPFFMTIILGALQAIPRDLYEAADVDGASWFQKLRRITLPMIRPAIMPGVVLSALLTFKLFESVWMVTSGGPFSGSGTGATEIVMVYAYRQAFQLFNYGYTSAFAVLLFILLFAATVFTLRYTRITRAVSE